MNVCYLTLFFKDDGRRIPSDVSVNLHVLTRTSACYAHGNRLNLWIILGYILSSIYYLSSTFSRNVSGIYYLSSTFSRNVRMVVYPVFQCLRIQQASISDTPTHKGRTYNLV